MVLLIMKLDQLDKEIENALSSSLSGTPNLKRRIISVSGHQSEAFMQNDSLISSERLMMMMYEIMVSNCIRSSVQNLCKVLDTGLFLYDDFTLFLNRKLI